MRGEPPGLQGDALLGEDSMRSWSVVLAVMLLVAGSAGAKTVGKNAGRAARSKTMENPIRDLKPDTFKLSNGLTVFLVEDHRVPLVAIDINYQVGSKNEKRGRTGFAHLFEHLMFQGSKHYDDDYFKPLQDIGGQVNGATSTDRTRYWEVVPAGYLERALWLEADRMGFLPDAMTQERLDNQRSVVQNERRQNYENRPYGTVWEKTLAVLYPVNHPYNWPTIGSMEDLTAATLDDVKDFFKTYYAPNNASVALVGDFDPKAAKAMLEKLFGAIPPGPPVSRVERWVPKLEDDVDLVVQDRVQLPRTYFTWHTVPLFDADDAALDAFAQVLGGGKTSRLYQELVYKRQIAQEAVAFHMSSQLAGVFQVMLTPRPGHTTAEVEAAAAEVIGLALDKGVTADELARVQTSFMADFVRSMQNIGGFGGIADRLNAYYHGLGDPDRFRYDLQRYLDLDVERVNAVGRKYLGAPRVAARVLPLAEMNASTSPEATNLDRSTMPSKGPESPFHLPVRERFTMQNGMEVTLVEHHALPLVSFSMVLPGGSSAEPADRPGLASLVANLMQEGAGGKSSKDLADALEALGAQLELQASTDAMVAQLSTLKAKMDDSLALMADVILRPALPADELERQRTRRLVQLRQVLDQAQYLAFTVGQKVIYGDHPYGRPGLGTPEGVAAITLDDAKGFWQREFVAGNARLIVVGDVTRPEVEAALAKAFGAWPKGATVARKLPSPPPARPRTIYLVDKPGAAQSVILAGLPGVARTTPDYAIQEVLNTALGGQFVSRLNLNLREDKGYTYGARTRFDYGVVGGDFTASAPVQTQVTAPALKEMLSELEGIAGQRPLTKDELAYSIGSIVNGYARRFATPGQIAAELGDVVLYGLPDDAPEKLPAQVQAVSAADVARVASALLPIDKVAIVVVGDAKAIRADLEALKVGAIVELDREGKPVK